MAGKGGGAWKVAYADFVTAMMAFFLVMWIVAQNDQVKEAIAHHFSDPFSKESEEDGTAHQRPPRHPAPARATDRPEHEEEAGGTNSVLLMTQGGDRTSIGTVIHFADDVCDLDDEGRRRLKEIAPLLVGKPQKIEIRGHSSRRPLPSDSPYADHWEVSYKRCLAVMQALEKLHIPRQRVRLSQAAGFEPLAPSDEQLAGAGPARVEVMLLNETTGAKVAENGSARANAGKLTEARHLATQASPAGGHSPSKSSPNQEHAPRVHNAGEPAHPKAPKAPSDNHHGH